MSCEAIAKVLLLDDDTIRTWYRLYEGDGIEGLTDFSYEGSACQLAASNRKSWSLGRQAFRHNAPGRRLDRE